MKDGYNKIKILSHHGDSDLTKGKYNHHLKQNCLTKSRVLYRSTFRVFRLSLISKAQSNSIVYLSQLHNSTFSIISFVLAVKFRIQQRKTKKPRGFFQNWGYNCSYFWALCNLIKTVHHNSINQCIVPANGDSKQFPDLEKSFLSLVLLTSRSLLENQIF